MPRPLIPKLKIPLALAGGELATVEQGSEDDVAQCVYVILATPLGSRVDDTRFGVEDPTFDQLPLDLSEMLAAIHTYEPAAQVETAQEIEEMAARVSVGVST